jgi:formylglycine-generating enzyme required for sulfatase activity
LNQDFTTLKAEIEDKARNLPRYANRYEALIFCAKMNQLNFIEGQVFDELEVQGYRFNLPTEVQWEYACRAGTKTRFYNGNTEEDLDKIAWYTGNSKNSKPSVGEKLPNDWGFHDMLGNVSEWCLDELDDYPIGTATDWIGKNNPYGLYVNRGGYTGAEVDYCRSARRNYNFPLTYTPIWGLRLCLSKIDYTFS